MSDPHKALQLQSITSESREVHGHDPERFRPAAGYSGRPALQPANSRREVTMLKKLLGAAAIAAGAYGFVVPAQAIGCGGDDQARAEGAVEAMADGPAKFMAQREIVQAQDAMLNGRMRGCAIHLSRAMDAGGMMTQSSYPATMAQAPQEQAPVDNMQEAPYQQQWGWKPLPSAY